MAKQYCPKKEHARIAQREAEIAARFTPGYRMATKAVHSLGDISRDEPSLCYVRREFGDCYEGEWVTGYGFIRVQFPKATTRKLTPDEFARFDGHLLQIGSVITKTQINAADVEVSA